MLLFLESMSTLAIGCILQLVGFSILKVDLTILWDLRPHSSVILLLVSIKLGIAINLKKRYLGTYINIG